MRKALVVGIDHYDSLPHLYGCVNDAHKVASVLERHSNGSVNFGIQLLTSPAPQTRLDRAELRVMAQDLFSGDPEIALFYFAGHGYVDTTGGFLCASDTRTGDDGLSLHELLTLANRSKAQNKVIILDSCHSGVAAASAVATQISELREGTTILTASTDEQYANEENGSGVFTTLLIDALNGAAANLVGEVTPGSVYAHIDQSLGPWDQRPVFKTNVKTFVSLRQAQPPISLEDLRRITEFFPRAGYEFPLDPSFEPSSPAPDPDNTAVFWILQKYNRVNLLVPVDVPHMYDAAMESKRCKLTVLGEHYRRLRAEKRI